MRSVTALENVPFTLETVNFPLCARCTGEFYSAAISLIFFAIFSKKQSGMPGWKLGVPLLILFAAFGIDGSNSFLYLLKQTSAGALSNIPNLYIPNNTLRLFTGSGMGIALASILYPAFNQSAWKDFNPGRALGLEKTGHPDWHYPSRRSCHSHRESNRALSHCDPECPGRVGLINHRLQHGLAAHYAPGKRIHRFETDVAAVPRGNDSRLSDDLRDRPAPLQTHRNLGRLSPGLILTI